MGSKQLGAKSADTVVRWLWALLLISIPFTSHPITARILVWSPVSPLAAIPLIGLTVVWLPSHIIWSRTVPKLAIPLLVFAGVAAITSLLALFLPVYPTYGQSAPSRELRALLTLGVGIAFYLVASTWPSSEKRLRFSLRWVYIGGVALLIYSTFQLMTLPTIDNPVPEPLIQLHRLFSVRDPFRNRITGFAYEPSWLGNQLVLLYIPLWLGSVIASYSIWRKPLRQVSIELVLLFWGMIILFFSFARLAWISLFLVLAVLLVVGSGRVVTYLLRRWKGEGSGTTILGQMASLIIGLLVLTIMATGVVLLASRLDDRIADALSVNLATVFSGRHPWPYLLANELRYAERLMYWVSGLRIFSLYPVLGLGLGNSGFLMESTMPAFGYLLPEIIQTIHLGEFGFPNPKSLWIRLLSETGVIGFALFVAWLTVLGAAAARLVRGARGIRRAIGLATLLALLAQITEGFSLDTFGLPHLWVMLGLLTAASQYLAARDETA